MADRVPGQFDFATAEVSEFCSEAGKPHGVAMSIRLNSRLK